METEPETLQEELKPCMIILVDDDFDDRFFASQLCEQSSSVKVIIALPDGVNFVSYLKNNGFYDYSVMVVALEQALRLLKNQLNIMATYLD